MVTTDINLKYRGTHQYKRENGENTVSFFSLFPYGIFDPLFTKCELQINLHLKKRWGFAVMYIKKNNKEELK